MKIDEIGARELFDSRGTPTVEVEIKTAGGKFRAMVPSGASTGVHEALELRDKDPMRFLGKGVKKAVENVNLLGKEIKGLDCTEQEEIDQKMIEADGKENKSNYGANAILGISMAVCRAGASANGIPLFKHIANMKGTQELILPVPSFNVLNGGSHAGNSLAMQEFMIMPIGTKSFKDAMRAGAEVYQNLKKIIKAKYGQDAVNVGDEGGFAPDIDNGREALELLRKAIEKAGYVGKISIAMDIAASEFYENGFYNLDMKSKSPREEMKKSGEEMIEIYQRFTEEYNILSIEDPFDQDDWENHVKMTDRMGDRIQIVGDDLLVTNPERIKKAIDKKAVNALLLKLNQIGTVTESIQACSLAQEAGWNVMVSHRSGETEDHFIADLVVGLGNGQIKSGAPCRSERLSKYNQLLRIEEELGKPSYAGSQFS